MAAIGDRQSRRQSNDEPYNGVEFITLDDIDMSSLRTDNSAHLFQPSRSQASEDTNAPNSPPDSSAHENDQAAEHASQQEPLAPQSASGHVRHNKTLVCRLGRFALVALICAPFLTAGAFSFVAFLWFSDFHNTTWHSIMVHEWATRATTIMSLLIRTFSDLQSGICAAMIASIALEAGSVRLGHAASMSTARATNPLPHNIILATYSGSSSGAERRWMRLAVAIILCLTTYTLQFCSTILLADLRLGLLPGFANQNLASYDFDYPLQNTFELSENQSSNRTLPSGWYNYGVPQYVLQPREPTWMRSPPAYPAFAEYAEFAPPNENVDDTGTLLRAFLPFADAQSRENIRNYTGKALILDSRVSCQRPKLDSLHLLYQAAGNMVRIVTTGRFAPSFPAYRLWTPSRPLPFDCSVFITTPNQNDKAPPAICQLQQEPEDWPGDPNSYLWGNGAGGLLSTFSNVTDFQSLNELASQVHPESFVTWGTAFLVLNATSHQQQGSGSTNYSMEDDKSARLESDGIWTKVLTEEGIANFSVSLCYAAWDTTRADVAMFSDENRTEPIAKWDPVAGLFTTPDISLQLGNTFSHHDAAESRGILNLDRKDSWITAPEDAIPFNSMPFVQNFGDASRSFSPQRLGPFGMQGNWTTVLHMTPAGFDDELRMSNGEVDLENPTTTMADDNIASLFAKFFTDSSSLARTMSSMITVLSSMAYYDQMARFQTTAETTQVFWVNVIFPQARAGFVTIAVLLIVHNTLVGAVLVWFLLNTRSSLLGSYWQSIAQLETPQTADARLVGIDRRDRHVDRALKAAGREKETFLMHRGPTGHSA